MEQAKKIWQLGLYALAAYGGIGIMTAFLPWEWRGMFGLAPLLMILGIAYGISGIPFKKAARARSPFALFWALGGIGWIVVLLYVTKGMSYAFAFQASHALTVYGETGDLVNPSQGPGLLIINFGGFFFGLFRTIDILRAHRRSMARVSATQ